MDSRRNDIAVDLLENQNHDDEIYGQNRLVNKQNYRARRGADERAEKGNDIGDADKNADQRRIGHAEDLHHDNRESRR